MMPHSDQSFPYKQLASVYGEGRFNNYLAPRASLLSQEARADPISRSEPLKTVAATIHELACGR